MKSIFWVSDHDFAIKMVHLHFFINVYRYIRSNPSKSIYLLKPSYLLECLSFESVLSFGVFIF